MKKDQDKVQNEKGKDVNQQKKHWRQAYNEEPLPQPKDYEEIEY